MFACPGVFQLTRHLTRPILSPPARFHHPLHHAVSRFSTTTPQPPSSLIPPCHQQLSSPLSIPSSLRSRVMSPISTLVSQFSTLSTPTRLTAVALVLKVPACYMATKKRRLTPEEAAARQGRREEKEERKREKKENEPTEAQWWRANDGVWADQRQQNHHKRVSVAHFRAEETYTKQEYNDYIKELTANREIAVHENREKKMMDDEPDSEDDSAFPGGPNRDKLDKALLNAITQKDKELIERKYSSWLEDDTRKKHLWLLLFFAFVLYFPFDSRNPDSPA